ncbi:gas vesicle protein [Kribbella pittospori]|uniref:Gas vesicle protein n=1 Tax=Kribbella pittospori TaxID=722689 RepID=A0A4R0K4I6_9ACTN|nr:gas vesicle protein [Kribbella pittospori]TCC54951.1 gas vesicle protein [Kribbella pittospori]
MTSQLQAAAAEPPSAQSRPVALVDLLDRLLGNGVVLSGDVVISLADVELVRLQLAAVIHSVRATDSPLTSPGAPS